MEPNDTLSMDPAIFKIKHTRFFISQGFHKSVGIRDGLSREHPFARF